MRSRMVGVRTARAWTPLLAAVTCTVLAAVPAQAAPPGAVREANADGIGALGSTVGVLAVTLGVVGMVAGVYRRRRSTAIDSGNQRKS